VKNPPTDPGSTQAAEATLARETLRSSVNLAALGSLMLAFAHDGNNRLMVIMSCLDALSLDTLDEAERREALALATGASRQLADDLAALLTGARGQVAQTCRIELTDALHSAIELYGFMTQRATPVTVDIAATPWLRADPTQLQPALLRLLLGAERLGATAIRVSIATFDQSALVDELPQLRHGQYAGIDFECVGASMPQRLVRAGSAPVHALDLLRDPDGLEFAAVEAYAQALRGALHVLGAGGPEAQPRVRLLLPLPPQH
jgi:hypothetical protein